MAAGRDTNSNDALSLRCRVFIGNLSTDKTSKREIEDMFSKFGSVKSISLHNNFGFVQFTNEKSADEAVLEMHGKAMFGKRVDVNLAGVRRKPQTKDKFEGAPSKDEVVPPNMMKAGAAGASKRNRSRSPHAPSSRSLSPMSRYEELYKRDDPYGRDRYDRRPYDDRPPMYDRPPPREYAPDPYHLDRREEAVRRYDYPPRDDYYRPYPAEPPRPRIIRPEIDCEILSISKEQSRYAEEVESRLRSIGLVCNIGFPRDDVPISDAVDHVARCGTLYAVVVSDQNAQHRSCTLNILHGPRQEHRNMPLDDALSFVARNFDSYLRVLREQAAVAAPFRPPPPSHYPPYEPREEFSRGPPPPRHYGPPPTSSSEHPVKDEKKMSTNELTAMIEKLRREKEAREKNIPDSESLKSNENGIYKAAPPPSY